MDDNLKNKLINYGKNVFDIEIEELKRIKNNLDINFKNAIDILNNTVNENGKLIILGIGKSGNIGKKMSATFTSTGMPSVLVDATNILHGDLGIINKNDVALLMSYSGETEELIRTIPHIKRFAKKIISMTSNENSTLAKNSDVFLNISVKREACPLNLAPTSSTTASLVMGDALAMALLSARGFREQDFAKFHPSGQLGSRLLTTVSKIMRQGNQLAISSKDDSVNQILKKMTKARSGACVLTDSNGDLVGIFTQGDFVRQFQKNPMLSDQKVSKFMSNNPLKINQNKLVNSLLKMFEENKVDEIIVVDDNNVPVGIVDTQDLTKFRII